MAQYQSTGGKCLKNYGVQQPQAVAVAADDVVSSANSSDYDNSEDEQDRKEEEEEEYAEEQQEIANARDYDAISPDEAAPAPSFSPVMPPQPPLAQAQAPVPTQSPSISDKENAIRIKRECDNARKREARAKLKAAKAAGIDDDIPSKKKKSKDNPKKDRGHRQKEIRGAETAGGYKECIKYLTAAASAINDASSVDYMAQNPSEELVSFADRAEHLHNQILKLTTNIQEFYLSTKHASPQMKRPSGSSSSEQPKQKKSKN